MAKIIIIFFALLAFQASSDRLGRNQQQREQDVQILLKQIQTMGGEAISAVEGVKVEDMTRRRARVSQVNQLAHNVEEIADQLQQAIERNQGGKDQQILEEIARSISNIAHSIQQAISHVPSQLKIELKTQVASIIAEAKKLGLVIQQEQHPQINDELEDVLVNIVGAMHQLQIRDRLVGQNQEQVKSQIQAVTTQVSNVIQSVSADDQVTVQDLAHLSHRLAHQLGRIIRNLQREIRNQDGDVKNVLQQVVDKLSQMRAILEQASLTDDSNQVSELKNLLKTKIHNIAVQIERLVQVVHSSIANERNGEDLKNVVQGVLARSLVAVKQLQRDVETYKNRQ